MHFSFQQSRRTGEPRPQLLTRSSAESRKGLVAPCILPKASPPRPPSPTRADGLAPHPRRSSQSRTRKSVDRWKTPNTQHRLASALRMLGKEPGLTLNLPVTFAPDLIPPPGWASGQLPALRGQNLHATWPCQPHPDSRVLSWVLDPPACCPERAKAPS